MRGGLEIRVEDLSEAFQLFSDEETVKEALRQLEERPQRLGLLYTKDGFACVSVEALVGIPPTRLLADVHLKPVLQVSPETSLMTLLKRMDKADTNLALIVKEGQPLGFVRRERVIEKLFEEAERARELAQQLAAVFRASPLPIILIDEAGHVLEMSSVVPHKFGIRPEEVTGKGWGEVLRCLHRLDDPKGCGFGPSCRHCPLREAILKTFKTGKPVSGVEVTITLETDTGPSERVFLANIAPLEREAGKAAILTLEDITERVRAQEQERIISEVYRLLAQRHFEESLMPALQSLSEQIPFDMAEVLLWQSPWSGFRDLVRWFKEGHDPEAMLAELAGGPDNGEVMPLDAHSYADAVLTTGEPLLIPDISQSDFWGDDIRARHGIRSVLVYPLVLQEDFQALFVLYSHTPKAFTEAHLSLLQRLTPVFAGAVEADWLWKQLQELNATLEERVRRRTFELRVLYELSQQIGYTLDYDELFRLILQHLHQVVNYDLAGSLLVTDDRCELFLKKARPLSPEVLAQVRERMLQTFNVMSDIEVAEERLEEHVFEASDYRPDLPPIQLLHSSFSVPLIVEGKTIGLVFVGASEKDALSEEHLRILCTLANQASISIQRLQALLKAEQSRLEAAIESMREGVVLLDEERRIVVANPRARELLPLLTKARHGEPLHELGGVALEAILEFTHAGRHREIIIKGPPERVFEVTAAPFRTVEGEREGVVLVIHEVTQEREMQKRLQQQERLAVIGQLAGGIAHDFNNLLTAIIGFAELGMTKTDPNSPLRRNFEVIRAQGERAAQLVRQILDFSRRSVIERRPLDLFPFIKEMSKLLERTIPENILIRVEAPPDTYLVNADPTQVQQVIMNLATNARDAMPEGGTLTLRLDKVTVDSAMHHRYPEMKPGNYIRLVVEDTGVGMPPEVLEHAFEPFFSTKPPGEGVGLGLAQVYGIIRQHDGYIYLESEVNKGTRVIIYLPALEIKGGQSPEDGEEEFPHGRGETLLLVEDGESVLEVGKRMLERLGYKVLTARDGQEALRIYRAHQDEIALVLTDMVMPGIGGKELYRELVKVNPQVKVLLISGYSLQEDIASLEREGIKGYIQKPFQLGDLGRKVRKALEEPVPEGLR